MDTNTPLEPIENEKTKFSFVKTFDITKKKVLSSLMVSFAVFVMLVASAYAAFFSIAKEMTFKFGDFAFLYTGICLGIFAILFIALILCKGIAHKMLYALCAALGLIGGFQNMITTITFKGMPADGNALPPSDAAQIINLALWLIITGLIIWSTSIFKHKDFARLVVSFGLLFVMVTQIGCTVIEGINAYSSEEEDTFIPPQESRPAYLTTENMFTVSENKNVIVFILDRFDKSYFDRFMKVDTKYIDQLDGFTYYTDNIAKYPRTFPAVTSMLTGMEYDFSGNENTYMAKAYSSSPLLQELRDNNFNVNLYIPNSDGYKDAAYFGGTVTNTSEYRGYTVPTDELTKEIFSLGSYFWAPEIIKAQNTTSQSDLENLVTKLGGDGSEYRLTNTSDAEYYDTFLKEGLKTQSEKNNFTFLHLRGCHAPFTIDENCEVFDAEGSYNGGDVVPQTEGMFKFITEYLQALKDLDLYDDATIIITGDHAAIEAYDSRLYEEDNSKAKLTALLVKESGVSGTPLKKSSAQVSQDNFIPTIIKSAGIETDKDYGKAYSEVGEFENVERTHYLELQGGDMNGSVWKYTITGPGTDFNNWKREQFK